MYFLQIKKILDQCKDEEFDDLEKFLQNNSSTVFEEEEVALLNVCLEYYIDYQIEVENTSKIAFGIWNSYITDSSFYYGIQIRLNFGLRDVQSIEEVYIAVQKCFLEI